MRIEAESHELPMMDRPLLDALPEQQSISNHGILRGAVDGFSPRHVASSLLSGLKPEIFQRRKAIARPGPTAWLDGLRGCAAFCVCFSHLAGYTHANLGLCFGHETSPGVYYTTPANLPVIRLLFSGGHFSVIVFFCISGYVLTKRLISLLHQGRREEFIDSLNSAVFRRPGRLYLPVVWSTLLLVFIWHVGGIVTPWPPRQDGLFSELSSWFKDIMKFIYPFREGMLYTYYNFHTWTIPVELRGSLLVYIWLFANSQFTPRIRVLLTLTTVFYGVFMINAVFYAAFMAGLVTAELDLIYAEDGHQRVKLPWDGIIMALRVRPRLKKVLLHVMLVVGLYLAGEPFSEWYDKEVIIEHCPIWHTLGTWIPAVYEKGEHGRDWRWFWMFWAAWLLLVSIKEISWARKLFETAPVQYLGKNSFALYLMHGPIIGLLSERLFYLTGVKSAADEEQLARFGHLTNKWLNLSWWPFPAGGPDGFEPNFLFCLVISLITFLYAAELGTKVFDTPSVKLSRWAYNKLKAYS